MAITLPHASTLPPQRLTASSSSKGRRRKKTSFGRVFAGDGHEKPIAHRRRARKATVTSSCARPCSLVRNDLGRAIAQVVRDTPTYTARGCSTARASRPTIESPARAWPCSPRRPARRHAGTPRPDACARLGAVAGWVSFARGPADPTGAILAITCVRMATPVSKTTALS
jgi:hypothetical protein